MSEKQLKAHFVTETIQRPKKIQKDNQEIEVIETVQVTKRRFPVRKCVLERKNFPKFGDLAGYEYGQNKKGELNREADNNIVTQEDHEKFEIDIVNKIKGLNTEQLKVKRGQDKTTKETKKQEDTEKVSGVDRMKEWAEKAENQVSEDLALKIQNISLSSDAPHEGPDGFLHLQYKEEEKQFREFIDKLVNEVKQKHNITTNLSRWNTRFYRIRGYDRGMARAFVSFKDSELAKKVMAYTTDLQYNSCILDVSWAGPPKAYSGADREKEKPRKNIAQQNYRQK